MKYRPSFFFCTCVCIIIIIYNRVFLVFSNTTSLFFHRSRRSSNGSDFQPNFQPMQTQGKMTSTSNLLACLARLKLRIIVQEVAVAQHEGRPRRRETTKPRRRATSGLRQLQATQFPKEKCRYIPVWFDWSDLEDILFQQMYRRSILGPIMS